MSSHIYPDGPDFNPEPLEEDPTYVRDETFEIRRFFKDPDRPYEVQLTGLSLADAQAHCRRPETSTDEFFDGYTEEGE